MQGRFIFETFYLHKKCTKFKSLRCSALFFLFFFFSLVLYVTRFGKAHISVYLLLKSYCRFACIMWLKLKDLVQLDQWIRSLAASEQISIPEPHLCRRGFVEFESFELLVHYGLDFHERSQRCASHFCWTNRGFPCKNCFTQQIQ